MANALSQTDFASSSSIEQPQDATVRAHWVRRARVCLFGVHTDISRPLPAVTPSLAARIEQVSAAVAHARENPHIKGAATLIQAQTIYEDGLKAALRYLKLRDPARHKEFRDALGGTPQTRHEHQARLSHEFALYANSSSGERFFHYRDNAAYLYERAARKAGLEIKPQL